jgi:hypothetical protein
MLLSRHMKNTLPEKILPVIHATIHMGSAAPRVTPLTTPT